MTPRTRYLLVGSGLIVAVGLGVGLVAFYAGGGALQSTSAGPTEMAYLSAGTPAVAYADVRHIMDSDFRQRLSAVVPTGEAKQRLLEETGIDVERDIDSVTAGIDPARADDGGPLVLVRGRFDESRIEEVAVEHGATVGEYGGKRVLAMPRSSRGSASSDDTPAPDGGDGPGLAFLEDGLLALGTAGAIRRAIDASAQGSSVLDDPNMMKAVASVAGSSNAWVVGRADAVSAAAPLPDQVKEHLSTVQWFALSAGVDRAVTCWLRAEARDAETGDEIRAVINGFVAMARMMAGEDARWESLLTSLQATGTGSVLEMSVVVPPEVLDLVGSRAPGVAPSDGEEQ